MKKKSNHKLGRPTPEALRALRDRAGLTQSEAAHIIYMSLSGYQKCELGVNQMTGGHYELMRLKLGDLTIDDVMEH